MGKKNVNKKAGQERRSTMRVGVLALCCVLGVALLAGMAVFNRGVKPDRDMQWYVREGALEVAAPAMGDGFNGDDSEFVVPGENMRVTPVPTPEPTPEPTPKVTQPPVVVVTAMPAEADAQGDAPKLFEVDEDNEAADGDPAAIEGDLPEPAGAAEPEEEVPSGMVTLTITAAGDCTFGGMEGARSQPRFAKLVQQKGYDYFFDGVRDIFESDDLTIINLEGPLTNQPTKRRAGEKYVFRANPECVKIMTGSSVELCNVANNHSRDCGMDGLKETAKVLDENGIGFCGFNVAYEKTIKGVRVCSLGYTCWEPGDANIVKAVTEARQKCDLLIVNMHWGDEHVHKVNEKQVKSAHAIIDAGADLVIGTHPHVIQGMEKYKGKYIVYSLGNFSFAGNANPKDKRCLIFQQKFSFYPGMNLEHAGCADAGINLIPASVSSTADTNDFRPMVLPADQGASVLKLVAEYSRNFSMQDILWMRGNYMETNGLLQTGDESEDSARTAEAAENKGAAAPQESTEAEDESAVAATAFDGEDSGEPDGDDAMDFGGEDGFGDAEADFPPEDEAPDPFFD